MATKSRLAHKNFAPGTSRTRRAAHSLLLQQMAKEAQDLAAQAHRIAELREEKGRAEGRRIPQWEVADAVDVRLRTYQLWEAGNGDIKRENLNALAAYFGVTADYIEFGVERRERAPTPSLTRNSAQLDRIEDKLDQILAMLKEDTAADAVAAELEDLPGLLAQQDAPQKPPAPARHGKKKAI